MLDVPAYGENSIVFRVNGNLSIQFYRLLIMMHIGLKISQKLPKKVGVNALVTRR